ncbi:hypothetical protein CEV33_4276 [Brucella grignonensis]|uniref:Uncharacterized protein n=1 Tax=Brucella grignonensis TaxID=94627 RepID=A0A256FPT2_9HYPH|nr:hypothetical protein CEV33_4276 [Brucella grignonensis]
MQVNDLPVPPLLHFSCSILTISTFGSAPFQCRQGNCLPLY